MTCSYNAGDPTATTRDYVRLLTGDTDVPTNCRLTDEELDALIAESIALNRDGEWTKYCAAAEAIAIAAQAGTLVQATSGVERKRVGRLELESGGAAEAMAGLLKREQRFRRRCAGLMLRKPAAFSTLGRKRGRCGSCG